MEKTYLKYGTYFTNNFYKTIYNLFKSATPTKVGVAQFPNLYQSYLIEFS